MTWFLRAKHWQVFLGYAGIILLTMIPFYAFVFGMINSIDPYTGGFESFFLPFLVVIPTFLIMAYDLLYHWHVGTKLHGFIPDSGKFKLKYLHWSLSFPVIYIVLVVIGVAIFATSITPEFDDPRPVFIGLLFLIPLHLLAMICQFYRIYFMARTVKSVELGRLARFDECIVECLLFWFWIIGIWLIQPRVNELYEKSLRNALPAEE